MRYFLSMIIFISSNYIHAQYDSLTWDGLERTYLLHLPTQYDASEELSLVIAMHGGFGDAFNLQNQSQLSVKADEENFIVVYPEGVKGGFFDIRTWNAGWCCGHARDDNVDDVGFINALIGELLENYAIDENRIYATGMSNGGFMSYRLACELSDRIAAIAPVAASMSMIECNPDRPVPVIDFHSYEDFNVLFDGGIGIGVALLYSPPLDSVLNVWSSISNCSISNDTIIDNNQFTHVAWSNCICDNQIEQYITYDGGHSWPGGEATAIGDPVSTFINANDLMWSFFQNYSLECQPVSNSDVSQEIDLTLFPNPTNDKIFIDTQNPSSYVKVSIYNLLGESMLSSSGITEIDISHFFQGTYILRIGIKDDIIFKTIVITE